MFSQAFDCFFFLIKNEIFFIKLLDYLVYILTKIIKISKYNHILYI